MVTTSKCTSHHRGAVAVIVKETMCAWGDVWCESMLQENSMSLQEELERRTQEVTKLQEELRIRDFKFGKVVRAEEESTMSDHEQMSIADSG